MWRMEWGKKPRSEKVHDIKMGVQMFGGWARMNGRNESKEKMDIPEAK